MLRILRVVIKGIDGKDFKFVASASIHKRPHKEMILPMFLFVVEATLMTTVDMHQLLEDFFATFDQSSCLSNCCYEFMTYGE